MKKRIGFIIACCLIATITHSQKFALKTNLLYGATTTFNAGAEVALSKKMTVDFTWGYNPWTFSDNTKWKHWLVMPEIRYYLCERFNGHFIGMHTGYSEYNVGGIPLLYYRDARYYRYEGWATGAGLSYGYQWILGNRWNLEASAGFGVIYTEYLKCLAPHCGPQIGNFKNLFFSPTKAAISIIYFLK